MAIALEASNNKARTTAAGGVTTDTLNITVPGSLSNSVLVFMLAQPQTTSNITSVSLDGVALTQAVNSTGSSNGSGAIWYLANPAAGAGVITFGTAGTTFFQGLYTALVYSGVDQASPISNTNTANVNAQAISAAITCLAGGVAVATMCVGASPGTISLSAGATDYSLTTTFDSGKTGRAATQQDATSIGWTWNGGVNKQSGMAVAALRPASGGGGATATTLSGPSGGVVSVASSNFTVGANGAITGTVTVTPSDGGDGGTFTPTSVAISSGTPTATFTYTPASTGVKTISISDDGGLTDASSISYTVSSGSTGTVSKILQLMAA